MRLEADVRQHALPCAPRDQTFGAGDAGTGSHDDQRRSNAGGA